MTDVTASPVDDARRWADGLIRSSHRGPGDTVDAAIHRAAAKHGLDHRMLWRLRYRSPKDLLASVYVRIKRAYELECERQEARLRHELEITRQLPSTEARRHLVAETEALLRSLAREEERGAAERADASAISQLTGHEPEGDDQSINWR